ncbi:beta-1,3-glucan-binding protein-like isoform X1 [Leptidea sinapis]|uniref:beta-1,3-glucan-binding protein-like isoform X1 n=1 Tax=Leptidea sinapis TaxID=189913 RepID=UPI00213660F1|nr:beta-1,3-glucan-binding protein-like isoform X1 [Leptidea sinapis]
MVLLRIGFCIAYLITLVLSFDVPSVVIHALKPKGIRVFLPDKPGITFFLFHGKVFKVNATTFTNEDQVDEIWGFGNKLETGGWLFLDTTKQLHINQRIRYRTFVSIGYPSFTDNDALYGDRAANLTINGWSSSYRSSYLVEELIDPESFGPHCRPSRTKVHDARICSGQTIFEDQFDSLREDNWQIAHYIPIDHPEHPFVSYQRLKKNPTVSVQDGMLIISPKLQQDLIASTNQSLLTYTLDLTSGCTEHRICQMSSVGVDIIPPIVSGRVTSARFAFTYGTVYIRAKFPQGDWIYPEILLEPLSKKYGSLNYASGVLKIALARGNMDVISEKYSNNWLDGGPILNAKCLSAIRFYHKKLSDNKFWGDDFHVYMLKWTPEEILLEVDGEEWGRYVPGASGLRSWLPKSCRGSWFELLTGGEILAPFDDHMYITLGVAVGGITEFADGLTNNDRTHSKPWRNRGKKASLSFWQDREYWLPTWTQPDLLIDYVKVVAL